MNRAHRTVRFSTSTSRLTRCEDLRVLLIDDDDTFRAALEELLKGDGHPVHAVGSLPELPDVAELSAVAAVVTDYELKDKETGLGFAKRFNAIQPTVPVIIVTAYASGDLTRSVAAASYLSLLRKPIRYDDLHDLIHQRV